VIETSPFGKTGHQSTRVIFGAAALGGMKQDKADGVLEVLLEYGINHIDTAASYGDSELRIFPWMREHRKRFFLATKTGDRTYDGARDSLNGALEALVEARDKGLVRFIGITGHGTRVAAMHRRSLDRFAFDSVLFPYNFTMMGIGSYAADVEELLRLCAQRGVAIQTIKSAARRRWQNTDQRKFSWYEPLRDREALRRAVFYVMSRPGLFLNTSSDTTILRGILEAASEAAVLPARAEMEQDVARY